MSEHADQEPEEAPEDTRWPYCAGSIIEEGDWTVFSLFARTERAAYGQRVAVETKRLQRQPALYARTLGFLARDIGARV